MKGVISNFGESLSRADTNENGQVSGAEFMNNLSDSEKYKIQEYLKTQSDQTGQHENQWEAFKSAGTLIYRNQEESIQSVSNQSSEDRNELRRTITRDPFTRENISPESNEISGGFNRTLSKGLNGPDVALLQKLLTEAGFDARYNGVYDGDFGSGTQGALINYQRQVLGQKGDGVMDLNGATMRSLLENENSDNDASRRVTQHPYHIGS